MLLQPLETTGAQRAGSSVTERASCSRLESHAMNAKVGRELGMEGRDGDLPLAGENRLAAEPGEHVDALAHLGDARRADEKKREGVVVRNGLEAVELTAVR